MSANFRVSYFDAATFASDTSVAHAFVLSAVALPVFGWSKDSLAEQTVFFWFERSVIDRFRLRHFSVRPAEDALGRSYPDLYVIKAINASWHVGSLDLQNGRYALRQFQALLAPIVDFEEALFGFSRFELFFKSVSPMLKLQLFVIAGIVTQIIIESGIGIAGF